MSDDAAQGAVLMVMVLLFLLALIPPPPSPPPPQTCDVLGVLVKVDIQRRRVVAQNTTPHPLTLRTVRELSGGRTEPTLTIPLAPGETWEGEAWPVDEVRIFGHPSIPTSYGRPR